MKIVIDARYIGSSGIGRFLENIIAHLGNNHEYTLLGKKDIITKIPNFKYIFNEDSPFSTKALFKTNTKEINQFDYYFTPNFIIPYGIKTKVIATLHDIIFLDMKEVNKGFIETRLKQHLLKRCMKKAEKVFTVSEFSKKRIIHYFPKYAKKIMVHYPGVAEVFKSYPHSLEKENYLLFIGNIKKNKGLSTLLKAMPLVNEKQPLKLYIVGDKDSFKNKDQEIEALVENTNVEFTGKISDEQMLKLLTKAKFLIQPSHYEGFGAPPLEAMYVGCRPIISDIEVFKEVYGSMDVIFFKDKDEKDLANQILSNHPSFHFDPEEANKRFNYEDFAKIIEKEFK